MNRLLTAILVLAGFCTEAQPKTKTSIIFAQCTEQQSKHNENGDDTIFRTCTYKNYRSFCIGEPDYKGRTSWWARLYIKRDGNFVAVSNANFFKPNANKLLAILNKKFKENFKKDKAAAATDPESASCFIGRTTLDWYTWDNISIEVKDNGLNFGIYYGLGSACFPQDQLNGALLSFEKLKPYLRP